MKVRITFKDPDGVDVSLDEAVREQLDAIEGLSDEEREQLSEIRRDTLRAGLAKWISGGEYLDVDFDIEAGTATVVPRR